MGRTRIPANFFTLIGVDIFYLKSAKIFHRVRQDPKTFQRLPKTVRRVQSNMNMGTQRNIDFPTKKREDHPHRLFFSLFGSGFFK